jgi:multiple sugar transport system ATP-binding protein
VVDAGEHAPIVVARRPRSARDGHELVRVATRNAPRYGRASATRAPPARRVLHEEEGLAGVSFERVSKVYEDGTRAVSSIELEIRDKEFMVLVGPSGCGKTTALRMVAGLEQISEGRVRIGERVVNHVPSRDRDIAMVFQSYALYPHLSVYENIAFGLRLKKLAKDEIERRVQDAARVLDLQALLQRKPRHLSGGQRQRVAMGRAIVREPQVFLMDEPLSNLDAKLRVQMRAEIARLQLDLGVTTIYVTHDQVEAMTMGDRVAVMRKGELQQVDSPQALYDHPVNLFVGGFIGSPSMNMLEARIVRAGDALVARLGDQRLTLHADVLRARPALAGHVDRDVIVGIRPEDLEDAALAQGSSAGRLLRGEVRLRESLGSEVMVHVAIQARPAVTDAVRELAADVGVPAPDAGHPQVTIVGRFSPRSRVRAGDAGEIVVDTRGLHFFDPGTGLGIYDTPAQGAATT